MKRGHMLVAIVCIGISGAIPSQGMATEPPVDLEKVMKEARKTIEATKQYTAQQKEAFQRKTHEEFVVMRKQIITLRGKASEASAATRTELQRSINELEVKKNTAKNKLDEFRTATKAKWSDVKLRMNSALDELRDSYEKALSHLP